MLGGVGVLPNSMDTQPPTLSFMLLPHVFPTHGAHGCGLWQVLWGGPVAVVGRPLVGVAPGPPPHRSELLLG